MAWAWSFVELFQTSETQGASDTESKRQPSLDQRFLKNVRSVNSIATACESSW